MIPAAGMPQLVAFFKKEVVAASSGLWLKNSF